MEPPILSEELERIESLPLDERPEALEELEARLREALESDDRRE